MEQAIQEIFDAILVGDAETTKEKVQYAIDQSMDPAEVLNQGMISAMAEVGVRFEDGEYFVPEMLIAARAMQEGLAILKPLLLGSDMTSEGRVVIGS